MLHHRIAGPVPLDVCPGHRVTTCSGVDVPLIPRGMFAGRWVGLCDSRVRGLLGWSIQVSDI